MRVRTVTLLGVLPLAFALSACGGGKGDEAAAGDQDPALTGALGDQIMVDPDLATQNRGNAALTGGGPATGEIPKDKQTPEFIAAAKAEAAKLAGGAIQIAPAATAGSDAASPQSVGQLADVLPGNGSACAAKAEFTTAWAAKLPQALPVYPRGHVQEAAGTDKDGCRLRVVNFQTPVGIDDVINFYYTRVRAAGFDAEHSMEGTDHVLGGSKGAAAYMIHARKLPSGLTEVDLIANGG
jgi:hypothetical protein